MSNNKGKAQVTKEELSKIKKIIEDLEQHPSIGLFLEPVPWKEIGLTDYPVIIKNPMDISTIKKKMKGGKYQTANAILDDIQLIWDNCKTYNLEGTVNI